MHQITRLTHYKNLSEQFRSLNDQDLVALIFESEQKKSSPWGESLSLKIENESVFIKLIPVTKRERDNLDSTVNLFDLPLFYHYGVGSAGFGVWRELEAHKITTNWVLEDKCWNFPLMYHHRLLSNSILLRKQHQRDLEKDVSYWDNNAQIRKRLTDIDEAADSLIIVLEHFPQTIRTWIQSVLIQDHVDLEKFVEKILEQLTRVNEFMQKNGFVHFDAHFENLLTDGQTIYFSDFGLSLSQSYDLSQEEVEFLNQHLETYDQACSIVNLLHMILSTYCAQTKDFIGLRDLFHKTEGKIPTSLQPFINKHLSVGLIMDDFFGALINKSKSTPYPSEEVHNNLLNLQLNRPM